MMRAKATSRNQMSGNSPLSDLSEAPGACKRKNPMRILVIEDEPQLARHVSSALNRHGHSASVQNDGVAGLQAAIHDPPDLVVLDINLPGLDGFSVLAKLRELRSPARVIILTARGEVENRVKGLKGGADDYLAKPFSMDELVARVEALGRRGATPNAADLLKVADLQMDVQHRRVSRAGQVIALSPRENRFDTAPSIAPVPDAAKISTSPGVPSTSFRSARHDL